MSAEGELDDPFERFERETPEPKLELIDGRLVIGNSLAGSAYYLHDLLSGWRARAVVPFATPELWRQALQQAFTAFLPPGPEAPLKAWQAWAEGVSYRPELAPAGPRSTGPHYFARERLNRGVFHIAGVGGFGCSFGHDFVMHLGDDGFTPDGMLIGRQATERLFQRYLNGPADLVWEVLLPGHERQDREVKFHKYETGGVQHYWVIDPESRTIDFFRLVGGGYRREQLDEDGRLRPAALPGLAFVPDRVWKELRSSVADHGVFEAERRLPGHWSHESQTGIDWDDVAFAPRPQLEPKPITFEESASWCPRAKFEGDGERTTIEGRRGTRNVLGMLVRTFGLVKTASLLHPRAWVQALKAEEKARRKDAGRRARWWDLARKAASRLRSEQGATRIAVIGSLTQAEPLHFWSELSLVAWDLAGGLYDAYEVLRDLDTGDAIDLIDAEHATGSEQRMIGQGAIEIS